MSVVDMFAKRDLYRRIKEMYLDGARVKDIAEAACISERTAYRILHRVKAPYTGRANRLYPEGKERKDA